MKSKFVCMILIVFVLFGYVSASSDTTSYKLSIGYDRGVSLRLFPKKTLSLGLVVRPARTSILSATLYEENRNETVYDEIEYSGQNVTKTSVKGAGAFFQIAYVKKLSKGFSFSPYLEIGAEHSTERIKNTSYVRFNPQYYYPYNTYSHEVEKYKTTKGVGEIGIMPGFSYGRFSLQFKLGIGGVLASSKEECGSPVRDGEAKSVYMRYPTYDIINSFILHIAIF